MAMTDREIVEAWRAIQTNAAAETKIRNEIEAHNKAHHEAQQARDR